MVKIKNQNYSAMEKRKSHQEKPDNHLPLPLIKTSTGTLYKYKAVFNGYHVIINNPEDMVNVNNMGTFGKGTLSRNKPQFAKTKVIRKRQLKYRKDLIERQGLNQKNRKAILVTPDSDDDEDDGHEIMDEDIESEETDPYFSNLITEYAMDHTGQLEVIHLLLEEAFFLFKLDCLELSDENGTLLDLPSTWKLFMQLDDLFLQNYVVYHYYRSKNWIVKSGVKFGGDYVLYKESPEYCHSSYVIVIDVLNQNFERIQEKTRRSMKISHLLGLNRLCETVGKDFLITHLIWPVEHFNQDDYNCIRQFGIKEILFKRWTRKIGK